MYSSQDWWSSGAGLNQGGGDPGDPITQSLRFRKNQYLQQATAMTVAPTTQTWSMWFKRGDIDPSASRSNFLTGSNFQGIGFGFWASYPDQLACNAPIHASTEVFRDPSAWYHLVVSGDTSSSRQWVNGVELTGIQSLLPAWNTSDLLEIGTVYSAQMAQYGFDGHIADVHFIDGQALDHTTFGRFNSDGVWVPVDPEKDGDTAWYGANGFHLDFSDPTDVGKDLSGNGNDFTANGFDTVDQTSPTYDIMKDSPTNNFATGNPLVGYNPNSNYAYTPVLSDANLTSTSASFFAPCPSTTGYLSSGKYYFKFQRTGGEENYIGIVAEGSDWQSSIRPDFPGWSLLLDSSSWVGRAVLRTKETQDSGASAGSILNYGITSTDDGPIVVLIDIDNHQIRWDFAGVEGPWLDYETVLPANAAILPYISTSGDGHFGFGQQQSITPPEEFLAVSTANMSTDELPDTITGTFIGNSDPDGPFVYTGCTPARIQYDTIDVKYQDRLGQTDVDFLSNGFKVRSTTSNSGAVSYTVTTTHDGGEYDGNKVPFQLPAPAVSN